VDTCHVTRYSDVVIRSFADKRTEQLWVNGRQRRLPQDITRRAVRRLSAIDAAATVDDLRVPPGNRLHALEGDRAGQPAVSISDQWRVCFRFEDGDAYEVEVCDYH
jgi:toxin HigB-1